MTSLNAAAEEFLAQKRIAVAGVSRDQKQPANLIYRRLRTSGHQRLAVDPSAEEVEGDPSFAAVLAVGGVVIVTPSAATQEVVGDCAAASVPLVWLHGGIRKEV